MKQAELARRLDTSAANVSRKLSGGRGMTLEELQDYADAIGVPAFQLVAGSENARNLSSEERAILNAFNALDRGAQLTMLAEFANAVFQAHEDENSSDPQAHVSPKH